MKKLARYNFGSFATYIGNYNEHNLDSTGEVPIESEVDNIHTMESNLSRESTIENMLYQNHFQVKSLWLNIGVVILRMMNKCTRQFGEHI